MSKRIKAKSQQRHNMSVLDDYVQTTLPKYQLLSYHKIFGSKQTSPIGPNSIQQYKSTKQLFGHTPIVYSKMQNAEKLSCNITQNNNSYDINYDPYLQCKKQDLPEEEPEEKRLTKKRKN